MSPLKDHCPSLGSFCALRLGVRGGCIDTVGWAELIANWPGTRCSRPGRETRRVTVSFQCSCMLEMEIQLQLAEASPLVFYTTVGASDTQLLD